MEENNLIPDGAPVITEKITEKIKEKKSFFARILDRAEGMLIFLSYAIIIFVVLSIIGMLGSFFYLDNQYRDRVLPNIYFDGASMSGKSKFQVEQLVGNKVDTLNNKISLKYLDKEVRVKTYDLGFSWDEERTVSAIYDSGKGDGFLNRFISLATAFINKKEAHLIYKYDSKKSGAYLEELSSSINKDPVDSQFEIKNNKVTNFEMGSNGQKLLVPENIKTIGSALVNKEEYVDLEIEAIEARGVENMDKMGVKELVTTGISDFSGSPPNRVHNINVGAQAFNGILIAPGEDFSFIAYLGEVSAKTGYLPELVIKEDKTIPEYGGGLCQVSTTFFRAAINAGLPILERTAHAYRVYYYEPAGMDATIYDPKPDLVFQNDTEKYILVQTRIEGFQLFVDLYGTSDGRVVDVSAPTIYNYVQPGEPIMIETTELAPGEKRQTDTAHVGADAYFDRVITYTDGTKKEERFSSHYVPWRAKFLVGKEPEEESPEKNPIEETDPFDDQDLDPDSSNDEAPIVP